MEKRSFSALAAYVLGSFLTIYAVSWLVHLPLQNRLLVGVAGGVILAAYLLAIHGYTQQIKETQVRMIASILEEGSRRAQHKERPEDDLRSLTKLHRAAFVLGDVVFIGASYAMLVYTLRVERIVAISVMITAGIIVLSTRWRRFAAD